MREIKFRAWTKRDKKMFYTVCPCQADFYGCDYLMQYTGLKDKNGKEIYEGDIVRRYNANCVGVNEHLNGTFYDFPEYIKWVNGGFSYCIEERNSPMWWLSDNYTVEVIGNIYENPKLLGEKDDKRSKN